MGNYGRKNNKCRFDQKDEENLRKYEGHNKDKGRADKKIYSGEGYKTKMCESNHLMCILQIWIKKWRKEV